MRDKRRLRAERKERGRRAAFGTTDPDLCECGHHAGLAVVWHDPRCPVSIQHREAQP